LLKRIAGRSGELPVWDGELYLEYHRGTYTTHAWLKRANRKNEILLHQVEWLAALARRHGFELDREALDRLWKDLLLMQFHDILPGSSVGEVYEGEIRPMQQRITESAGDMLRRVTALLAGKIDTPKFTRPVVLFNTLGWDRQDAVRLPDGTWRDGVLVPASGWTVIEGAESGPSESSDPPTLSDDGRTLTNRYWDLTLNDRGEIQSLHDRLANRNILAEGQVGNELQLFQDRPMANDAWDIDHYYTQYRLPGPTCQGIQAVERSPARVATELRWSLPQIGDGPRSTITQRIALYAHTPRIDFETTADWHDHHQVLKVAFPVRVRSREASYQIQFGHLRRPTHTNTSWDAAKFECCAHQFVDLGEHGYGVALLNDCKYGHDIHENVIRLTCIRSPQAPDFRADQGRHEFTYALLPHAGSLQEGGVIRRGAELNNRLIAVEASPSCGELPAESAPVRCDWDAVVIETIKPAEDGRGLILRLYESHGASGRARLFFENEPTSAAAVNLLEEPIDDATLNLTQKGSVVSVDLRPFQIVSLRILHD